MDDDAEKTGSPFDFLNDVLDEEHDLNNAKAALDSPNTRDVINQNGNLTDNDEIFVFFSIKFYSFNFVFFFPLKQNQRTKHDHICSGR